LLAGSTESSLFGVPVDVEEARGANVSVELESLFLRYAFFSYGYTLERPAVDLARSFLYALSAVSPALGEVSDGIDTQDIPAEVHEVGIRWEQDVYTVDAEIVYLAPSGEKLDLEYLGAYVSLTRQAGPHAVYGVVGADNTDVKNDVMANLAVSKNDIPIGAIPVLDLVRQEVATTVDRSSAQFRSLTLGYRYDFTEYWNIKTELQSVWFDEQFAYDAYTTPPDAPETGQFYIVRLVTDWVF
jgi:hypothetical protein